MTEYIKTTDELKEVISALGDAVPVVLGCLDNNGTRKLVDEVFSELDDFIWIDGGNAERHGQVYVAVKENGVVQYDSPVFLDEGLQDTTGDNRRPDEISCAEIQVSAPQNITANIMSATLIFSLLNIVLDGGLLLANKYEFDTRTMSVVKSEVEKETELAS